MAWTTVILGGHTYRYLGQTENQSCLPTCVAMYVWNRGVGLGFDYLAKRAGKWSKYALGLKPSLLNTGWRDNYMLHGTSINVAADLLRSYGLNYRHIMLGRINGLEVVQNVYMQLTDLPAGTGIIFCSENHAALGLVEHNGLAFLNPAQPNSPNNMTMAVGHWYDAPGYGYEILGQNNMHALFLGRIFGPIRNIFILPRENVFKVHTKSALQALKRLHQYATYWLN